MARCHPPWGLDLELVVLHALDERDPLAGCEEDGVLRFVIRVPNRHAFRRDCDRRTAGDESATLGEAGFLEHRIFHAKPEFHLQILLSAQKS